MKDKMLTQRPTEEDIDVVIKLDNCRCTYSTKKHRVTHDDGPYSRETCIHTRGICEESLADQVALDYADVIASKRAKQIDTIKSDEYNAYLDEIDEAMASGVHSLAIDPQKVKKFGLPRLVKGEDDDVRYNLCTDGQGIGGEPRQWYLFREPIDANRTHPWYMRMYCW